MPTEASVASFLDKLYDAAVMPDAWPNAVREFGSLMAGEVGNVMSHMTVLDIQSGQVSHNMIFGADPELVRQGTAYYFQKDVHAAAGSRHFMEALRQGQTRVALVSSEMIPADELLATEYYQDFLRPFGVNDMLCASALVGETRIVNMVANPLGTRQFERRDKELVSTLLPHVDRAFRMSLSLGHDSSVRTAAVLWDASALPVMIVQERGLAYANAAANALLAGSPLIRRSGRGLVFADEAANAALRGLTITRRSEKRSSAQPRQVARLIADGTGGSWMLQMVRMNTPREDLLGRLFSLDPGTLVMLTPLNAVSATRTGSLDSLAGFTGVEREILRALVDGQTIRQISRATGRSEATLRWHVRNLLSKTGLATMTDLVRIAALLLPF